MNDDIIGLRKVDDPSMHYTLFVPPPAVGSYKIGEFLAFNFPVKPNWFHRMMTRILLGWKWVDA